VNVFLYVNVAKPRAKSSVRVVSAAARRAGLRVVKDASKAEILLALGGDGTILRAVHEYPSTPVLGINFGSLGYLSSVGADELDRALGLLAKGRYRVSERTMLSAGSFTALNEIVIMRESSGHAAVLDVSADGKRATRYLADGVIVATPTGSTAYSFSAGGPVVLPDAAAIAVTPMNPHALGVRPAVIRDDVRLTVTSRRHLGDDAEKLGVYVDGESAFTLSADESVEIRKAERRALLVELDGYDPYAVLAKKLGWGETK